MNRTHKIISTLFLLAAWHSSSQAWTIRNIVNTTPYPVTVNYQGGAAIEIIVPAKTSIEFNTICPFKGKDAGFVPAELRSFFYEGPQYFGNLDSELKITLSIPNQYSHSFFIAEGASQILLDIPTTGTMAYPKAMVFHGKYPKNIQNAFKDVQHVGWTLGSLKPRDNSFGCSGNLHIKIRENILAFSVENFNFLDA